MRLILLFVSFTIIGCNDSNTIVKEKNNDKIVRENRDRVKISFETIDEWYASMNENGLDTNVDLLYGYFFTNEKKHQLELVWKELEVMKFEFVSLDSDDTGIFWLHVERVETHNAKSLFELNKILYGLEEKYNLESYDGFDVGHIDENKALY